MTSISGVQSFRVLGFVSHMNNDTYFLYEYGGCFYEAGCLISPTRRIHDEGARVLEAKPKITVVLSGNDRVSGTHLRAKRSSKRDPPQPPSLW